MKIAINLLPFRKKIAGAGKYAQKIVQELSKMDNQNDYYLFVTEQGKSNFKNLSENFHFITPEFNPELIFIRIFWEQFIFPGKLKSIKPDRIFTPSVAIPLLCRGIFYTTIHDLAYKKSKHKYSFLRKKYIGLVTNIAAKKSRVIFTVSNFSKVEIEKHFKLKNKKVLVTYNGVEDVFFRDFSETEKSVFVNNYKLPDKYILYVGAIEPGKNLDKVFQAFSKFLINYKLNYFLVLTSGIGWNQDYLMDLIKDLGIQDKIIFLPYIPENELPLLYKCAEMLVYLSDYEGFGIPVLEALASGTPVITSKSEAIKEFAGQAVISVDSSNIDDVNNMMYKVITNKDFKLTKINEGKLLAEKFKWKNSAEIIYKQLTVG